MSQLHNATTRVKKGHLSDTVGGCRSACHVPHLWHNSLFLLSLSGPGFPRTVKSEEAKNVEIFRDHGLHLLLDLDPLCAVDPLDHQLQKDTSESKSLGKNFIVRSF